MNMTCKELMVYLNEGAISVQARKHTRFAKQAYTDGNFEAAMTELAYAYTLGSVDAIYSMKAMIEKGNLGTFELRDSKDHTLFVFDYFSLYRRHQFYYLPKIADRLFYGMEFNGDNFEKYQNSYKFYRASWEVNKDYYSLYSMGKSG
jgi:hypothetical protein